MRFESGRRFTASAVWCNRPHTPESQCASVPTISSRIVRHPPAAALGGGALPAERGRQTPPAPRGGAIGGLVWWRGGDSNPRPLGYEPNELPLLHPASTRRLPDLRDAALPGPRNGDPAAERPRRPRLPWGRPQSTLRRCGGSRPGSGWDRVGPPRSRPRALRGRPPVAGSPAARRVPAQQASWRLFVSGVISRGLRARRARRSRWGTRPPRAGGARGFALGHEHCSAPVGRPPSTRSLATRSSSGGLTNLHCGETRLGQGFPLRCFQRFARPNVATQRRPLPDDWPTSGSSTPVLSY